MHEDTRVQKPLYLYLAYLSGVVNDREVTLLSQVGLAEFGMFQLRMAEFVHIAAIGGLRKPALLIEQRQNTHRLK